MSPKPTPTKKSVADSGQYRLFTLRLWREMLDDDRFEWRGRVEFVETGEIHYFREDATVLSWLSTHFAGIDTSEPGKK